MGPNMGPPFGRRTAEKRLELKIYMGYTMAHEFGEHIPDLLSHRSSRSSAVSLSTPAIYSTYCIRQHTLIVRQIRPFIENEESFRKFGHGGNTWNSIPRVTTVTDF